MPAGGWVALASVALLQIGHLAYGGVVADAALAMTLSVAVVVGAALLAPSLRRDLPAPPGLGLAAGLFLLVMLAVGWSLTPWGPGRPDPMWTAVDARPSASIDRSATLVEAVKLLGLAGFFLAGALAGRRDERARFAAHTAVIAGAAYAAWAIAAAATGAVYQSQGRRMEALFLNPNTAGGVFAALFVLAAAVFWRDLRRGGRAGARRYALALSALVLGVAVIDTASRGAIVAGAAGLVVLAVLEWREGARPHGRPRLGLAVAGAGLLLAVMAVLAGDLVVGRFARAEGDLAAREAIWRVHGRAFQEAPVLGHGLGAFETVNRARLTPDNFEALGHVRAPLNLYLQWLEEGGLAAAVPMFLCVGVLVLIGLRGVLRRERMRGLLAGLVALDVVFIAHGLTDSALQSPSVAALWAWALGLQAALADRREPGPRAGANVAIAAAAMVTTALAAGACLVALNAGGEARLGPLPVLKLAAGYDRRAGALLAPAAPSIAATAEAARLSRAALAEYPYDNSAWLRLAYVDALDHGRLTPDGVEALQRSYRLAPIDIYAGVWRIAFALENSSRLPPDLRGAVRREFDVLWADDRRRGELVETAQSLRDPAGRLTALVWLNRLNRRAAREG